MKVPGLLAATVVLWNIPSVAVLAEDLVISAPDGQFLGRVGTNGNLCSEYDSDCIWNHHSTYGSEYSSISIFNNYSQYGSGMGRYSVCNEMISYEETPSLFLVDGNYVAFYDVIGPDSETQIGYNIYVSACLR